MEFSHYSVMLSECIDGLNINPDGIYVDCTAGGGGHSIEILKRLKQGKLISIDQDDEALAACKIRFKGYENNSILVKSNFSQLDNILKSLNIDAVDGVLMDLGVSSHQLDTAERGFSYNSDAELDMRMDPLSPFSAYDVVNTYSEERLADIIFRYGEEKFSRKIAKLICERRKEAPLETTMDLVDIIKRAIPEKFRQKGSHPAKRTFQAIRIEVNSELSVIAPAIDSAVEHMNEGGRIAIISFHSLEDRCVKSTYQKNAQGCTCPPDFPVCICGNKPKIKILTKKPILPSKEELEVNHRSHSAKLRVAEKI